MSIFKKARKAIRQEVNQGISEAKRRLQNEAGNAINRVNKFLYPGTLGVSRNLLKSDGTVGEPLYYPMEAAYSDNLRTDRTTYWLKITIEKQQTLQFFEKAEGIDLDIITNQNRGITERVIWLYLPQLTQSDQMDYDNVGLGFFGRSAAAAVQGADNGEIMGSILSAGAKQIDQGASAVSELRKGGTPSIGTIAAAVGFTKNIPVINKASNAISFTTGIAKDPHTIALFQGVNLRQHQFEFNMVPESAQEAQQIEKIVQVFREAMYPISVTSGDALNIFTSEEDDDLNLDSIDASIDNSGINLAFIFPNTFKLNAYSFNPKTGDLIDLSSKGLFYKDCVLVNCTVDFDPGKDLSQRPGYHFPATNMSLQFTEVETLNRQDIRNYYRKPL